MVHASHRDCLCIFHGDFAESFAVVLGNLSHVSHAHIFGVEPDLSSSA